MEDHGGKEPTQEELQQQIVDIERQREELRSDHLVNTAAFQERLKIESELYWQNSLSSKLIGLAEAVVLVILFVVGGYFLYHWLFGLYITKAADLNTAILFNNEERLNILLSDCDLACINQKEVYTLNTPLHSAAISSVEALRALVDRGADVNAENKEGETPLHLARTAEMTQHLLQHAANHGIRSVTGKTALFYARSAEQVHLLVKNGARVNAQDHKGDTALLEAIQKAESVPVLEWPRYLEKVKALLSATDTLLYTNHRNMTAHNLIQQMFTTSAFPQRYLTLYHELLYKLDTPLLEYWLAKHGNWMFSMVIDVDMALQWINNARVTDNMLRTLLLAPNELGWTPLHSVTSPRFMSALLHRMPSLITEVPQEGEHGVRVPPLLEHTLKHFFETRNMAYLAMFRMLAMLNMPEDKWMLNQACDQLIANEFQALHLRPSQMESLASILAGLDILADKFLKSVELVDLTPHQPQYSLVTAMKRNEKQLVMVEVQPHETQLNESALSHLRQSAVYLIVKVTSPSDDVLLNVQSSRNPKIDVSLANTWLGQYPMLRVPAQADSYRLELTCKNVWSKCQVDLQVQLMSSFQELPSVVGHNSDWWHPFSAARLLTFVWHPMAYFLGPALGVVMFVASLALGLFVLGPYWILHWLAYTAMATVLFVYLPKRVLQIDRA